MNRMWLNFEVLDAGEAIFIDRCPSSQELEEPFRCYWPLATIPKVCTI